MIDRLMFTSHRFFSLAWYLWQTRFCWVRVVRRALRRHPRRAPTFFLPVVGARVRRLALRESGAVGIGCARHRPVGSRLDLLRIESVVLRFNSHVREHQSNVPVCAICWR